MYTCTLTKVCYALHALFFHTNQTLLPQGEAEILIHSQENLQRNGLLYPSGKGIYRKVILPMLVEATLLQLYNVLCINTGSTVMAVLDPQDTLPNLVSNVDVNVVIDCSQVAQAVSNAIDSRTQPIITWERLTPAPPSILSSASLQRLGYVQTSHIIP